MKARLETLKRVLCLEWGELAESLGISRAMLDHVRTGRRSFGPKAIRRLEQAETDAGIRCQPNYIRESNENYATVETGENFRRELKAVKHDLEALVKRVDEMMRKIKTN